MSLEVAFEIAQASAQVKRIADVLTTSAKDVFIRLPGLAAYWPMGIRSIVGLVTDHSATGSPLSSVGINPTGFDGNSFVETGSGGVNYLTTSFLGLTGTETYIEAGIRGITLGGWFWTAVTPVAISGIMGKDGLAPQRGWSIYMNSLRQPVFLVSAAGTTFSTVTGPAVTTGSWNFIVGRFSPGAELAVFVNGVKTINTSSIPASAHTTTADFEVGRHLNADSRVFDGRHRDLFLCATMLDDDVIEQVRLASLP